MEDETTYQEEDDYCRYSPDPPELQEGLRRLMEAERINSGDERAVAAVFARPGEKRAVSEIPTGWAHEWDDSLVTVKRFKSNYWAKPCMAKLMLKSGPSFTCTAAIMIHSKRQAWRRKRGVRISCFFLLEF
uniref:Uncharacterized protein n=1 Tax=Leersia perrieri TaxID=77586 RepID=A0A0D9WCY3_9ORYZ